MNVHITVPEANMGDVLGDMNTRRARVLGMDQEGHKSIVRAEVLAPKLEDRALFDRELKFVLETPAEVIPELVPEQTIEKKKADFAEEVAEKLARETSGVVAVRNDIRVSG